MSQAFDFEDLVKLCRRTHEESQRSTARATDTYLVTRNWLFGYIVEYEQHGADRAEYGRGLIISLSGKLKAGEVRGCSPTNLRKFREFYLAYAEIQQAVSVEFTELTQNQQAISGDREISETASPRILVAPPSGLLPVAQISRTLSAKLVKRFSLGWSHYVSLLTIDNPEERRFYELEAAGNGWSVRELERQIASSLYERLALSRDKEEVRRLASEGQVIEIASDLIKNPLVLEFLDLEEKPVYSESELETAIIDRLQHFLLELGKGFLFEARQKRFTFDNSHSRERGNPVLNDVELRYNLASFMEAKRNVSLYNVFLGSAFGLCVLASRSSPCLGYSAQSRRHSGRNDRGQSVVSRG